MFGFEHLGCRKIKPFRNTHRLFSSEAFRVFAALRSVQVWLLVDGFISVLVHLSISCQGEGKILRTITTLELRPNLHQNTHKERGKRYHVKVPWADLMWLDFRPRFVKCDQHSYSWSVCNQVRPCDQQIKIYSCLQPAVCWQHKHSLSWSQIPFFNTTFSN